MKILVNEEKNLVEIQTVSIGDVIQVAKTRRCGIIVKYEYKSNELSYVCTIYDIFRKELVEVEINSDERVQLFDAILSISI